MACMCKQRIKEVESEQENDDNVERPAVIECINNIHKCYMRISIKVVSQVAGRTSLKYVHACINSQLYNFVTVFYLLKKHKE